MRVADGYYGADYNRRSRDLDGLGKTVARQKEANHKTAADEGVTIPDSHSYTDNDAPASRFAKKPRTEWRKLTAAIEAEPGLQFVFTTMVDRLLRIPGEMEYLITLAHAGKFTAIVTPAFALDLTTSAGRSMARNMADRAAEEVEILSLRVKEKFQSLRDEGQRTGKVMGLGWYGTRHGADSDSAMVIHDGEADTIRDAARSLLAGVSLSAIARTWNEDGLRKPMAWTKAVRTGEPYSGTPWTPSEVANVLANPRNAGYQTHKGEVIGKPWPEIVDQETWERLAAYFARRKYTPRAARAGEWSGIVRCAGRLPDGTLCGATMLHSVRKNRPGQYATFQCSNIAGTRRCGRNYANGEVVRDVAHAWIVAEVNGQWFREDLSADDQAGQRALEALAKVHTDKVELEEMLGAGEISRAGFARAMAVIREREAEAQRAAERVGRHDAVSPWLARGDALAAALSATGPDAMTAEEHRAVFLATGQYVWITPPTRPGEAFTPARVHCGPLPPETA